MSDASDDMEFYSGLAEDYLEEHNRMYPDASEDFDDFIEGIDD